MLMNSRYIYIYSDEAAQKSERQVHPKRKVEERDGVRSWKRDTREQRKLVSSNRSGQGITTRFWSMRFLRKQRNPDFILLHV